ncbi:hypothetical protein IFM12275_67880 [Nocardia sputorum]|uniref:hypothetical protein n=1 Tax=Nocardia TaxID=1817 RepID=UPI0024903C6F|nr:hypothetical protein [Nocardia sputorum]BDT96812.1 hypothetical protein IFM12275_67880 [Nocardia sputorum]
MATEPASQPHRDKTAAPSSLDLPAEQPTGNARTESAAGEDEHTRETDTTTRSGRYALTAALCAALISSIVSASAAVYVTVNKADRDERLALVQVALKNRKDAYHDFLASAYGFVAQVGAMAGYLRVTDLDGFRTGMTVFADRLVAFMAAADLASMASSEDMYALLQKFPQLTKEFIDRRYEPFVMKHMATTGIASDDDERKRDSAALDTALMDLGNGLSELLGQFTVQGRKELT